MRYKNVTKFLKSSHAVIVLVKLHSCIIILTETLFASGSCIEDLGSISGSIVSDTVVLLERCQSDISAQLLSVYCHCLNSFFLA